MHGMRMMHSFLAIARLMVFGGFLVLSAAWVDMVSPPVKDGGMQRTRIPPQ